MLEGNTGETAIMDDILIAGYDVEHHDQIFKQVMAKATAHNLRLNYKCHIRRNSLSYVGHTITAKKLQPDPKKVRAIADMHEPRDKAGVKRLLGSVTYLAKLIPNLSDAHRPLKGLC